MSAQLVEALRLATAALEANIKTANCNHWLGMNEGRRSYAMARDAQIALDRVNALAAAEAPAVAQPVAWLYWHPRDDTYDGPDTARKIAVSRFTDNTRRAMSLDGWLFEPLYRAAAPLPAPLTDEQIYRMWTTEWDSPQALAFGRAIERAHGIGSKS